MINESLRDMYPKGKLEKLIRDMYGDPDVSSEDFLYYVDMYKKLYPEGPDRKDQAREKL